jgi:hypothetical protein
MRLSGMTCITIGIAACGGGDDGGGDDGGSCSEAVDDCSGETICIGGSCEDAFGRVYEVRSVEIMVPTTDLQGEDWDLGGGAADLLLEVMVNGTVVASAPAVQDSFSATFAGPYNVQPVAGGDLAIVVYDEDISANDLAFGCEASPLTAEHLRGRALACMSGGTTLTFEIAPR